jgi:hypothetical protein
MAVLYTNNATTTLAANITSAQTTLTVANGAGALFPSVSGSNYFYATLVDASNNIEIVKVTARTTDTFTIVRGQENTLARAYVAGNKVELRVTAAGLANKLDVDGGNPALADLPMGGHKLTGLGAGTGNGDSVRYEQLAALAAALIPTNTVMLFLQAAAPSGWTKVTTNDNCALRLVGGTGGGAYTSGTGLSNVSVSGTIGGTSITQAQLPNCEFVVSDPSHSHGGAVSVGSGSGAGSTNGGGYRTSTDPAPTGIRVFSGGSGQSHGHSFAGNALNMNYVDIIAASKN